MSRAMISNLLFDIMADRDSTTESEFKNSLRVRRQAAGLSQQRLAQMAGITRQAVAAVETGQYSPATSVALQLARALGCRVEDLFSIKERHPIVEAELACAAPLGIGGMRAQVTQVGNRLFARTLEGAGELESLSAPADGFILCQASHGKHVKVQLAGERGTLAETLVIAGCDPAMYLAAEHVRRHGGQRIVPRLLGSGRALSELKHGRVHAAGVHLAEERAGDLGPALKRHLRGTECMVITFAHWEEGLVVRRGNPKRIRSISDLARPGVRVVNRERGSGARRLLDKQLASAGIPARRVKGYGEEAPSHIDVAWRVASGLADTGIGVRAAARMRGLDFIPLENERYDLIVSKSYYETLPAFVALLDTITGGRFRNELEAMGGYDTRDTGRVVSSE